jgi:hypothetical protein
MAGQDRIVASALASILVLDFVFSFHVALQ